MTVKLSNQDFTTGNLQCLKKAADPVATDIVRMADVVAPEMSPTRQGFV